MENKSKINYRSVILGVIVVTVGMIFYISQSSENSTSSVSRQQTVIFGTQVAVVVRDVSPMVASLAIADIFSSLTLMHQRFHPWQSQSELSQINEAIANNRLPMTISPEMSMMLTLAIKYSRQSEYLFNPAIGSLVSLWGFNQEVLPLTIPSSVRIQDWLDKAVSMDSLVIEGNQLIRANPAIQIDLGGIAKGNALDIARAVLKKHGIKNALVDIGGNLIALGKNGNRPWRIALQARRSDSPLGLIDLYDGEAVATSGTSERFFMVEGKLYHHILNPRTGYPAKRQQAAIVISDDEVNAGAITDAAATALVIADQIQSSRIKKIFSVSLTWQVGDNFESISEAMQQRRKAQ